MPIFALSFFAHKMLAKITRSVSSWCIENWTINGNRIRLENIVQEINRKCRKMDEYSTKKDWKCPVYLFWNGECLQLENAFCSLSAKVKILGDLQMSKKRDIFLLLFLLCVYDCVGHPIVSSFNGEQLKKCDSLYISKGIRESSRSVFITHDLGDSKIHLNG